MKRFVVSLAILALPLSAFADDLVPLDLGGGQYLAAAGVPVGVDSVCMDAPGASSQCGSPVVADCGNPFIPAGCVFTFEGQTYKAPSGTARVFAAKFALAPAQRVSVRFACVGCRETTAVAGLLRDAAKPLAGTGVPFIAAAVVVPVAPPEPTPIRPAVDGLPTCTLPNPDEIVPLKLASGEYLAVANFPLEADSICFKAEGLDLPCSNSALGRTPVVGGKITVDGVAYNHNGAPIAFASAYVRKLTLPDGKVVRVEAYNGPASKLSAKVYKTTGMAPAPPPPPPPPDPNTPPPTNPPPTGPGLVWSEDFESGDGCVVLVGGQVSCPRWHNTSGPGEAPSHHARIGSWPACEHGQCLKQDQGTWGWNGSWQRDFGNRDRMFMRLRVRVGPDEKQHHFFRIRGQNTADMDFEPEGGGLQLAFFWPPGTEYTWRRTAGFPQDQWVELALYVKLNTPGQANGEFHTWVNGVHRFAAIGHAMRSSPNDINRLELVSNTDFCSPGGCVYHYDDVQIYSEPLPGYSLSPNDPGLLDSSHPIVRP